jgi:hypothetical protein
MPDCSRSAGRARVSSATRGGGAAAYDEDYQLTHDKLLEKNCVRIREPGGQTSDPAIQNRRLIIGCFPGKFQGGEAAFDGEWPGDA